MMIIFIIFSMIQMILTVRTSIVKKATVVIIIIKNENVQNQRKKIVVTKM